MGCKEVFIEFNWPLNYGKYLLLYEMGLKSQAKKEMQLFISDFKYLEINTSRKFVDEVNIIAFVTEEYSKYLPFNLFNEVVLPEIDKWLKESPNSVIPYRWSNDIKNNKMAIEFDPKDQISLEVYAQKVISSVSMNQHELNSGFPYVGSPDNDINLINFIESHIDNICDRGKRSYYNNLLKELKNIALRFAK